MPQQQTITTWFALNGANDVSPSGMADIRTGEPIFVGGLNVGDYFDLTEKEANQLSYIDTGLPFLHAGRYRRIRIDPNATAAQIAVGHIGFMSPTLIPPVTPDFSGSGWGVVTSADKPGVHVGLRPVIFLNVIDPGKYGFIQELGVASVKMGGAAAAGAGVMANTTGLAVAGVTLPAYIGQLIDAGVSQQLARVQLDLPVLQD